MTPNDIKNMADFVAQAIHGAVSDEDETWGDLTDDERADFLNVAHAAMGAHDAWLMTQGFVIAKPDKKAARTRGLAIPPRPKLIGLQ